MGRMTPSANMSSSFIRVFRNSYWIHLIKQSSLTWVVPSIDSFLTILDPYQCVHAKSSVQTNMHFYDDYHFSCHSPSSLNSSSRLLSSPSPFPLLRFLPPFPVIFHLKKKVSQQQINNSCRLCCEYVSGVGTASHQNDGETTSSSNG